MEVYKGKTLDAATNTIWDELNKIRKSGVESKSKSRRRWIWELIQNACDCGVRDKAIEIKISFDGKNILEFEHDGEGFTEGNLVDLVTQISSKKSSEEEQTGQFGTGFISTHLLAEKIMIESYLLENEQKFNFMIDRTAQDYKLLKEAIATNLDEIDLISKKNGTSSINKSTKFTYNLYDSENYEDSLQAVNEGIEGLLENIPFLLSFNNNIGSIVCNDQTFTSNTTWVSENKAIRNVEFLVNNVAKKIQLYERSFGQHKLAFLYSNFSNNNVSIEPLDRLVSKIYCKFPLIGTESFPFPMVINSKEFEVEKDRDRVREGSEINDEIFKLAVEHFKQITNFLSQKKPNQLYNICSYQHEEITGFTKKIERDVREVYQSIPLIEDSNGEFHCINNLENNTKVFVPVCEGGKEEDSDKLWELVNEIKSVIIPKKQDYLKWSKIISNNIRLDDILREFLINKNVETLQYELKETDVFNWLNAYYALYSKIHKEKFSKNIVVPDQNNDFVELSKLKEDEEIDSIFKEILLNLDENIYKALLSKKIILPEGFKIEKKNNHDVALKIQSLSNDILSQENLSTSSDREDEIQTGFSQLHLYFYENPEKSKELFPNLYEKRLLLKTKEENIKILKISDKITSVDMTLEEFNLLIEEREAIKSFIDNIKNDKSLSPELLKKMQHITNHSIYSKKKIDELMERTIRRVYSYLSTNTDYKLAESLEEWKEYSYSGNVFIAHKDKREVRIVLRPSDDDKIIFYYEQELDALDDNDHELWTDNGEKVRMVTLGDLIKTTGITVIPLRNLFEESTK